ncbi:unnamed protein product [Symbiodinium natans]|uniref:protein-serine/threonine phosphatase n=1 Tax=Symbiodinium natans TaxID=878477 RepID=A0A812IIU8_9DINO|nr:unnamed protein product [Symbiodinium natans]
MARSRSPQKQSGKRSPRKHCYGNVRWYNGRRQTGLIDAEDGKKVFIPVGGALNRNCVPATPGGLMHGTRVVFRIVSFLDPDKPKDNVQHGCTDVRPTDPDQIGLECGVNTRIGGRAVNEDRLVHADLYDLGFLAGVFDGHGGQRCVEYVTARLPVLIRESYLALAQQLGGINALTPKEEEQLIGVACRNAFVQTDSEYLQKARDQHLNDGSTGLVALLAHGFEDEAEAPARSLVEGCKPGGCAKLFVANCGDCRAVLLRGRKAIRLTQDHKPERPDETQRIQQAGGIVISTPCGTHRVGQKHGQWFLSTSRSFGDLELKEPRPLVIAEPELVVHTLEPEDWALVLASDGVWNGLSDQDVWQAVWQVVAVERKGAVVAAQEVGARAHEGGSSDNATVFVLLSGHAAVDGRYILQNEAQNQRPAYRREDGSAERFLWFRGGNWGVTDALNASALAAPFLARCPDTALHPLALRRRSRWYVRSGRGQEDVSPTLAASEAGADSLPVPAAPAAGYEGAVIPAPGPSPSMPAWVASADVQQEERAHLDPDCTLEKLLDEWVDHRHFEEIDSTQSFIEREHEKFNQDKLTAVSADFQTAGRGTGGRSWHATKAQSVMVSFFLRFPGEQTDDFVNSNAPNVTKVLAVAAVDTLQWATDGAQTFGIKWPNDVVVGGCKIGGILARAVPFRGRLDGIIVGIGLNVNTSRADLDAIARPVWPATSLWALCGRDFDVAAIRRRLVGTFAIELRRFFITGFAGLRDRVNGLDVLLGTEVWFRVHESEGPFHCVFEGIQEDGLILLRLDSGEVKAFPSGEIVPKPVDPTDASRVAKL